jgi:opacity protein-like surface antigen
MKGARRGVTMSLRRVCFFATLYLLCGATSLSAQYRESEHVHFEISPFGGSRFGGVVQLNPNPSNIDYFTIKSSWDYGVLGDVSLLPTLQAEFMWNRQPTELGAHNFFTGTTSQAGNATLDMYQFGFLYEFAPPHARLKPFVVGGLGFTHFATNEILNFDNRFSYNFGVGVKYFFTRNLGLRLEARYPPLRRRLQMPYFATLSSEPASLEQFQTMPSRDKPTLA